LADSTIAPQEVHRGFGSVKVLTHTRQVTQIAVDALDMRSERADLIVKASIRSARRTNNPFDSIQEQGHWIGKGLV
jgi:hypothetical protein